MLSNGVKRYVMLSKSVHRCVMLSKGVHRAKAAHVGTALPGAAGRLVHTESPKKKTMREDGRGQRTVYLQTTKQRRRDVRHACAVRKPSVSGKRRFSRTYTETPGSGAFSPTPPGRPETALSPAYGRLAAFSAFIAMSVRKCRPANRMRSALS